MGVRMTVEAAKKLGLLAKNPEPAKRTWPKSPAKKIKTNPKKR